MLCERRGTGTGSAQAATPVLSAAGRGELGFSAPVSEIRNKKAYLSGSVCVECCIFHSLVLISQC